MSAADDTSTTSTSAGDEPAPRSTTSVLAILGAIVALPLLALLIYLVLHGGTSANGGEDATEGVRDNRIQAVYLANDRVFFGDLEAGEGDWLQLHDAYFLRAKAAENAKDGEEASTTNLVPVEQEVGGDGTLLVNSREVVLVQNLSADSPIAQAIDDARHK